MSGGVTNLANTMVKTDSNGYLLVTIGGGVIYPDQVVMDNANRDVRLYRSSTKTLTVDDGAGAALTLVNILGPLTTSGTIQAGTGNSGQINIGDSNVALIRSATNVVNLTGATFNLANTSNQVKATVNLSTGRLTTYGAVTAVGNGVPSIYGIGAVAAQTTVAASIATYTNGAADADFLVSGEVNVTTSTTHSFSLNCTYTDPGGTSRVLIMPVAQLAGAFVASGLITNVTGAGPYESAAMHIRCKQTTAITIGTSAGTFTTVVYDASAAIQQVSVV